MVVTVEYKGYLSQVNILLDVEPFSAAFHNDLFCYLLCIQAKLNGVKVDMD